MPSSTTNPCVRALSSQGLMHKKNTSSGLQKPRTAHACACISLTAGHVLMRAARLGQHRPFSVAGGNCARSQWRGGRPARPD
jgi:hypothetical protein